MLPDLLDDQDAVSYAIDIAVAVALTAERERIAAGAVELDATWRRTGAISYLDRVRDRIKEMERHAAGNPGATWRGHYPGGAVDFETGRLTGTQPGQQAA